MLVADWPYQTHVRKYDVCKIHGRLRYPRFVLGEFQVIESEFELKLDFELRVELLIELQVWSQ